MIVGRVNAQAEDQPDSAAAIPGWFEVVHDEPARIHTGIPVLDGVISR
ncbi:MAG: hypothetical protein QOG79_3089 [Mycobacterium sp.]|jgi:hypothetical protein|nr:hypothetical protein [Mycobacterium sp.]